MYTTDTETQEFFKVKTVFKPQKNYTQNLFYIHVDMRQRAVIFLYVCSQILYKITYINFIEHIPKFKHRLRIIVYH